MKLALGTVQFGLDYGVSNSMGIVHPQVVAEILAKASASGIEVLDTATAYGTSEIVLGEQLKERSFRIISKTLPLGGAPILAGDLCRVIEAFEASLARLRVSRLDGLLVHHPQDLLADGGEALFEQMIAWKAAGRVSQIGVSVYNGQQIEAMLDRFPIDLIQVPINAFDQRLVQAGHLATLRARGVEIHVRSVFLQGLLLMEPNGLPTHLSAAADHLTEYRAALAAVGLSPLAGALAFIRKIQEVDQVVVGVTSVAQLDEILQAWERVNDVSVDLTRFALSDERIINPALWCS